MTSSVSVEKLEGLKMRLVFNIPVDVIEDAYQARLKVAAKKAHLKGFRSGKVPPKVLAKHSGKSIWTEVSKELIGTHLSEAISENHLRVVGKPSITLDNIGLKIPLVGKAEFEIYPEIDLQLFDQEAVTRFSPEVTDEDIDERLESFRKDEAEWIDVDRPAKEGDRVTIDFNGFLDGVPFSGGEAKNFSLILGMKNMIPGFEEGIIGMSPGETKEVEAQFPDDYLDEKCAGKQAVFEIVLKKVEEADLPKLDKDFIINLGVESGDLAELRDQVKKDLEEEARDILDDQLKKEVLEKLLDKNDFLVPESLVIEEARQLQNKARQQIAMQIDATEAEAKQLALHKEIYLEQAKKRVSMGLLLGAVVKYYNIKVDNKKIEERVEKIANNMSNYPGDILNVIHSNKQIMLEVETAVLEDQTIKQLLEILTVKEEKMLYSKAIQLHLEDRVNSKSAVESDKKEPLKKEALETKEEEKKDE